MPGIECVEDANKFVSACRYPPLGSRSWGPLRADLAWNGMARSAEALEGRCNVTSEPPREAVTLAMVETAGAMASLEQLCEVDGLTGLFVGPMDLGLALGVAPQDAEASPVLSEAIDHVRRTAQARGLKAGIYCGSGARAAAMVAQGFDLVVPSNDAALLRDAAAAALEEARG